MENIEITFTVFLFFFDICDALVPFLQFKKHEKKTNGGVLILVKKPVTLLKVTLLHRCFSRF